MGEVPELGRSGTTGNRVYLRVPRVRIPPSPSFPPYKLLEYIGISQSF